MVVNACSAGTYTENGHRTWISSKILNMVTDPPVNGKTVFDVNIINILKGITSERDTGQVVRSFLGLLRLPSS